MNQSKGKRIITKLAGLAEKRKVKKQVNFQKVVQLVQKRKNIKKA